MGGAGDNNLARLAPTQNMTLGMMAGVCGKACNYPFLTWKNATQQGLRISFNPSVVYRGLPMACLNLGGTTAVQFWSTGAFQKVLATNTGKGLSSSQELQAAALGGLVSGIPCSAWELTMIQQQRFGGSLWSTPVHIARQYGLATLLRGIGPSCGRESIFTLGMLGICPVLQRSLMNEYGLQKETALGGGALAAAFISAVATHPLDTIKTCMQGDVGQNRYGSVTDTARTLIKEHGAAQGLFKGLQWRFALIGTTFFLINYFKGLIAPVVFPFPPGG